MYFLDKILPYDHINANIAHMAYQLSRSIGNRKFGAAYGTKRLPSGEHPTATDVGAPSGNLAENRSVAGLSHDIRNQIYIIIGFAELMLEEIPGKINDAQRRNLNDVLKSSRRLLDLLQDIVAPSESRQAL
jgi:signal transduction histidine kinase